MTEFTDNPKRSRCGAIMTFGVAHGTLLFEAAEEHPIVFLKAVKQYLEGYFVRADAYRGVNCGRVIFNKATLRQVDLAKDRNSVLIG